MKDRVFKNWISSVLGLLLVIFSGVLLFVPTLVELSKLEIGAIASCGILLIFAKDKLIEIFTNKLSKNEK